MPPHGQARREPDNPYRDLRLYTDNRIPTILLQANQGNQADVREEVDALLHDNETSELRWLDGTHSLHWDRPDAVINAVQDLLKRTSGAGNPS